MLTQPMDPEKKSLNFIFPTKYVIPKSLKFSHWPSKDGQCIGSEYASCMDPMGKIGLAELGPFLASDLF